MPSFKCPFCLDSIPLTFETRSSYDVAFGTSDAGYGYTSKMINIEIIKCPTCDQWTISATGKNGAFEGKRLINPLSIYRNFPDYIPVAVRNDYVEAQCIKSLSPKAAATLARRCLQGMIRDFWEITENTLNSEISKLKGKVPPTQWAAIDGLRKIGNIGAHMEKDVNLIVDVEPDEVDKLLQLIELLLDKWYIARNDEEVLYNDIAAIAVEKKETKSH